MITKAKIIGGKVDSSYTIESIKNLIVFQTEDGSVGVKQKDAVIWLKHSRYSDLVWDRLELVRNHRCRPVDNVTIEFTGETV